MFSMTAPRFLPTSLCKDPEALNILNSAPFPGSGLIPY